MPGPIFRKNISGITPESETTSASESKSTEQTAQKITSDELPGNSTNVKKATENLAAFKKMEMDQRADSLRNNLLKQTETPDRSAQRELPKTTDLRDLPIDAGEVIAGGFEGFEVPGVYTATAECATGTEPCFYVPSGEESPDLTARPENPRQEDESKAEERSEALASNRGLPKTTDLGDLPIDAGEVIAGGFEGFEVPGVYTATAECATSAEPCFYVPSGEESPDLTARPENPRQEDESKAEERSEAIASNRGLPKTTDLRDLPIDRGDIDANIIDESVEQPTFPTSAEDCGELTNTFVCETSGICV